MPHSKKRSGGVNWAHCVSIFKSKANLQKHRDTYQNLRNAVRHVRKPIAMKLGLGRTAIERINNRLNAYERQPPHPHLPGEEYQASGTSIITQKGSGAPRARGPQQ